MICTWMMLWFFCWVSAVTSLNVQTQYGPIEGTSVTLFNGKTLDAYLGVPYATPPTGIHRFSPPQPPNPWTNTLETKALSKSCVQFVKEELKPILWFISQAQESEDCLYLNVWRPKNGGTEKLPVMVWIHDGAFFTGSASMPLHDGSILASHNDVIVVTINYRLELLGFLYLNTNDVPGNVGLQDQILAIKWVKNNIANFGGDPDRITLFGQSAGGISTSFHLINTQTQDLFQYAILESGVATISSFSLTTIQAFNRSLSRAKNLGCDVENVQDIASCLRSKPIEELLKGVGGVDSVFTTNVLPVRNGVEVPFDVDTAAQNVPQLKRKNALIGHVNKELGYLTLSFFPQKPFSANFTLTEADLRDLLANALQLADNRLQNVVIQEYKNYSSPSRDSRQTTEEIVDLVSDFSFICPIINFARSYVSSTNQVHYYEYTHRPSRPIRLHQFEYTSAVHGDETPFVFGAPLDPANGYTDDEMILSDQIMTFYKNFVRSGNPNGDDVKITWPPAGQNGPLPHIVFDIPSRAESGLKERQCDFWNSIYPQLVTLQKQLGAMQH